MLFKPSSYSPVSHVPDEVWLEIFDVMNTCNLSLRSVNRACRRFRTLTKPYIFRHIKFSVSLRPKGRPRTFFVPDYSNIHDDSDKAAKDRARSMLRCSTDVLNLVRSVSWMGSFTGSVYYPNDPAVSVYVCKCLERMPKLASLSCRQLCLNELLHVFAALPQLIRLQLSECIFRGRDNPAPARPLSCLFLRELIVIDPLGWRDKSVQWRQDICNALTSPNLESLSLFTSGGDSDAFFLLVQDMVHSLSRYGARLRSLALGVRSIAHEHHMLINCFLQSQPTIRSFSLLYDTLIYSDNLPPGSLPELQVLKIRASDIREDDLHIRLARSLLGTHPVDYNGAALSRQEVLRGIQDEEVAVSLNNLATAARAKSFEFTMVPCFSVVGELELCSRSRQGHKDFVSGELADHLSSFPSLRKLRFLPPGGKTYDSLGRSNSWLKNAVVVLGRTCPNLTTVDLGYEVEWVRLCGDDWVGYRQKAGGPGGSEHKLEEEKVTFGLMGLLAWKQRKLLDLSS